MMQRDKTQLTLSVLTLTELSHNSAAKMASVACLYVESDHFDEELFFSKMAADRGISLSCFLKVEVILEV